MSSKKTLKERFETIRHEHIKEDFEVGQAAQALHELKKSAKAYYDFLNGEFTEAFKGMLNRPETSEDVAYELTKRLEQEVERLKGVADEVDSFITDFRHYEDPNSPSAGEHRQPKRNRWSRWEHRTPRHVKMQQDREDGF